VTFQPDRPDLRNPNGATIGANIGIDTIPDRFADEIARLRDLIAQPAQAQQALANLDKIEHIVVLMLENRSFDHMLGYLRLEAGRADVDGLDNGMSNTFNGHNFPVHRLNQTVFEEDPGHSHAAVLQQLSNNNGGFVANFVHVHPEADPAKIMGYYNADTVTVYDHLAREFAICQRWFSALPGQTWPNRLYATTGGSDGEVDNRDVPLYNRPSFFRHLDAANRSWKWYPHDFSTLRLIDGHYRVGHGAHFDFAPRFFDDAAAGTLPQVSWIDPNFVDVGNVDNANDDHPPTDVLHAQELVLQVYNALLNSPRWNQTLLVITYDEHGGFYDHVAPIAAADDRADMRQYGVRVPAFIISPWVARGGVSSIIFDHTSIIKTVLLKFCRSAAGTIPAMGARVAAANHLGFLLTEPRPRPIGGSASTGVNPLVIEALRARIAALKRAEPVLVGARRAPNDFQREVAIARATLAEQGQPPNVA
jgi:phospholipase C